MAPFSSPANRPPYGSRPDGRQTLAGKSILSQGLSRGKNSRGIGMGMKLGGKRMRKLLKDNIQGVTRGDIRRMARRGGVKRISKSIYEDVRSVLKERLHTILRIVVAVTEHSQRKTVSVSDVIFALRRLGRPIWGFDPEEGGRTLLNG